MHLYGNVAYLDRISEIAKKFNIPIIEDAVATKVKDGIKTSSPCLISNAYTAAWSWDAPFVHTAQKYAETGNAALIWEGHKAGRDIGYCHLEKLHNLEALPSSGFYISCFPHKIRGASAGWTRAVAIFDDALQNA